jgi:hypothetical protein
VSGWIKLEKNLREDRRFTRMVDALLARKDMSVTTVTQMRYIERNTVTQVLGGLAQLWMFADSHIREDDTLDITLDEIDQLIGIEGFAKLIPSDWLEVLDENSVRLPDFQAHNGTDAKKKALTARRVKRHRTRAAVSDVTHEKRNGVTDALPDQTRLDQTRPDEQTDGAGAPLLAKTSDPKKRPSRRCPSDFTVTDELKAWASTECPGVDVVAQTKAFRDYEFRNSHSDWPATWRTWIRKAHENQRPNGRSHEAPRARAFPS